MEICWKFAGQYCSLCRLEGMTTVPTEAEGTDPHKTTDDKSECEIKVTSECAKTESIEDSSELEQEPEEVEEEVIDCIEDVPVRMLHYTSGKYGYDFDPPETKTDRRCIIL